MTYPESCKHFYKMCVPALGVVRNFKGHSAHPSAFCLDIFRGAGNASLLASSRSKSYENVARYSRGARPMLDLKSINPDALIGLADSYRMPLFLNKLDLSIRQDCIP